MGSMDRHMSSSDLDDLCSKLIACGLNGYPARIYLTLSSVGMAKVTELHTLTGIPRSKIYESLAWLETMGFVTKFGTNPVYYLALDGTLALLHFQEDAVKKLNELSECLLEIQEINKTPAFTGWSWFHSKEIIASQIEFRLNRAKRDVLIVCNDAETVKQYAPIIQETAKRIPVYPVTLQADVAKACPIKCYTTSDTLQRDLMNISFFTGEAALTFHIYFYFDRISTFGILNTEERNLAISNESDVYTDFVVKNFLRSIKSYNQT